MQEFRVHAAWTLLAAFLLSLAYELYRSTVMAGVSEHDSMALFVREGVPLYLAAAAVVTLLFRGGRAAAWIGLVFSTAAILTSIFYYNPTIMLARQPGLIDWFEDLVFTGLLFVAVTMLVYELASRTRRDLSSGPG